MIGSCGSKLKNLSTQSFIAIVNADHSQYQESKQQKAIDLIRLLPGLLLTPRYSHIFTGLGYLECNQEAKCQNRYNEKSLHTL